MISENIARVRDRVAAACQRSGRSPDEVRIVAVAKNRSSQEIKDAVAAGITDIAESRIQEAVLHNQQLWGASGGDRACRFHMVGHLQTNKVKEAVGLFDLIHSVDSLRLVQVLDKEAARRGKVQEILLQVNSSGEKTKYGLTPEATKRMFAEIITFKNIRVIGLMTIAPIVDAAEQARPFFRDLRQLRDEICGLGVSGCGLFQLSMGMTDDYKAALAEGATMLRLGRAIFEGGA